MPAFTRGTLLAPVLVLLGAVSLASRVAPPAAESEQPASQLPNFVPGPVTVEGSVSVVNTPTVQAQQMGIWDVNLAGAPTVVARQAEVWRVTSTEFPGFLTAGQTYTFTWSSNDAADYEVVAVGQGAWVQVRPPGSGEPIWMNTALLRSISVPAAP